MTGQYIKTDLAENHSKVIYTNDNSVGFLSGNFSLGAWGYPSGGNLNIPSSGGIQKVFAAQDFSVALINDGSVISWGNNNVYGQQSIPSGLDPIIDISLTDNTTYLIDWNKNLTGCGLMFNSGYVPHLTGVQSVAGNASCGIAILNNYTLTGWGDSSNNYLFTGLDQYSNIKQLSMGLFHVLALTISNTITGWGQNIFGQLNIINDGLTGIQKIVSSNNSSFALLGDGTVVSAGTFGNLPDNLSGVVDISAGKTHLLALTKEFIYAPVTPPTAPICEGFVYDT